MTPMSLLFPLATNAVAGGTPTSIWEGLESLVSIAVVAALGWGATKLNAIHTEQKANKESIAEVKADQKQVKEQVKNSHNTNLRVDLDRVIAMTEAQGDTLGRLEQVIVDLDRRSQERERIAADRDLQRTRDDAQIREQASAEHAEIKGQVHALDERLNGWVELAQRLDNWAALNEEKP